MSEQLFTWPDWMPGPLTEGYAVETDDRRLTSQTEAGSIVRRQFDTDEATVTCSVMLDRMRADWFEAFERDMLAQGSKWFEFPLWVAGSLTMHKVRFAQRPKASAVIGTHTRYEFVLNVAHKNGMSGDDAEILYYLGDQAEYFSNLLHWILHVQSPGLTIIPQFA